MKKKGMGRIRLHVTLDCTAYSLETFILQNIEPGSTIATDSWQSYNSIDNEKYVHDKTNQSSTKDFKNLYGVHLVTSLVKRLIRGTYQGRFESKYLQNYLDEYVFRFNRRKSKSIGKKFMRIVQQAVKSVKITYKDISWDVDPISEYYAT
jgi:transposase-like protein